MTLTERQWRAAKRIKWSDKHTRRVRAQIHDDKLMVGYNQKERVWVLARLCPATVMMQFGVRTIPTSENAPIVWAQWRDDGITTPEHPAGIPLDIMDPRLIPYIQRCDLWRQGAAKYIQQFDHLDWLEESKDRSEDDDLMYIGRTLAFDRVKEASDKVCGFVNRSPIEKKWHVPTSMKPWWEKTHDSAVV
jgi:hypothetical protein|tara:strand:- start:4171 stop:4740 length:570 start_codon:yes stop_codon:yes gene_type:complete